ncbi:SLATT domain-containing protein [Pseudomonas chlororaphis]|uniref:SLATT domain-containing protein n=1 Tax=Pseudomonas chlororaphis TaxID=587753 RepID=UPI0013DE3E46|nr:SLATT domain-containing protein [Pseudomonas chlororaphis]
MDKSDFLRHWKFRVHRVQIAHYEAGRYYELRHFWIGTPAIILSSLVGTAVFASLSDTTNAGDFIWEKIAIGFISILSTVLISLQTFLNFSGKAEKHKSSGAKHAHLKHKIELLALIQPKSDEELKTALEEIENEWNKIRLESLNFPTSIWDKIEKNMTLEHDKINYPEFGKSA